MKSLSILTCLVILFLLQESIISQNTNLYIPTNIQKAYYKGTRSYDGKPGEKYWQNHSDYNIKVNFDPASGKLSGNEKIIYHNESPDSLDRLIIRLYQNITKPEAIRDFEISREVLSQGVNIEKTTVNGQLLDLSNKSIAPGRSTNWVINLSEKLEPGEEVSLEIYWDFTIPKGRNVRMGYYGDSTYVIGYWYPQIAVYDDIDGWDRVEYTGQTEFYNDFSNYEVEISVPKGINVWATGVLQNPKEIFLPEYLKRYQSALASDTIIKIIDKDDLNKEKYIVENMTVWKYKAENVPDFVFATAGNYLWDAVGLTVDKKTNRRILINAAYNPASKDFYEVADIARKTIDMLSNDFPGVPFPYPCMTVFNGDGGMEFPMLVNDGSASERYITVHVTSHEITHTYFPFYMGTNERKYAWMDEGWANMIPFNIQSSIDTNYDPVSRNTLNYQNGAGKETEVPPMTLSYIARERNVYRLASYYRPAEAYEFLRETLGEEKFDNALREFINRWHGKHPMPYDFFFTFNDVTGEDLSWFWKPWFFEEGYPDLGIKDVKIDKDKINVLVEKKGNIPVPVYINIFDEGGNVRIAKRNLDIWKSGKKEIWIEIERGNNPSAIELGNNKTPDVYLENNIYNIKKNLSK